MNKRNFSKFSSKSKFGKEKSNKRFAGNINQSDMDFEEKHHSDLNLSCEDAGSSNSQEAAISAGKNDPPSKLDTEEGMYSYVSDDDLDEEDNNNIFKS